mgnify:CR=1 FL=1
MAFSIPETGTKAAAELLRHDLKRYGRQMIIDGWGEAAQKKLRESTVFVAGAGGLGSSAAVYLAAAGIGTIKICDHDVVEISNLNRQILHDHTRIGVKKALSARLTLEKVNNNVEVIPLTEKITDENADRLVGDADIIVDCMDNFPARYALTKSAPNKNIPFIFGSVWGMEGRLTFIQPPATPCLMCIFPDPPPREVFPIVGATAGVVGSLQALEAVKYLAGVEINIKGKLLVWDGGSMEFRKFNLYRDPECAVCGRG